MIARLRPAAAASHRPTPSARPGQPPSSETVEDDHGSEGPRKTPPHDESQRRRAEKTTVRPATHPHAIDHNKATPQR